ncbi:hypothetical protein ACHAQI_003109 [Fusarium lateritium]
MPRFQYSPVLPLEIRLLELQAGGPGDPLAGTVLHRILSPEDNEVPGFEALSYCWGDQSHPEPITITNEQPANEGQPAQEPETGFVNIGPNLASALQSLRCRGEKRIVWCDSICINQQDLAERASQVQRMADIYRHAGSVIVWLGPETSWSVTLMRTLEWLGSQIKTVTLNLNKSVYEYELIDGADYHHWQEVRSLSFSQWRALEQFYALDWHRRLWTYQEILLANPTTCVVRLGGEEMPWPLFKDRAIFAFRKKPPPGAILDPISYCDNAVQFSIRATAREIDFRCHGDWMGSIMLTMDYQCSDNRDRVFALRGLMQPKVARSITPDYTKSVREIFTSVCLDHLARLKDLEFLSLCNGHTSPTWVADLGGSMGLSPTPTCAAGNSAAEAYLDEPGVLNVSGISCDELCEEPILIPNRQAIPNRQIQTSEQHRQVIIDAVRTLSINDSTDDDDCLNKLIMALICGSVLDYSAERLEPSKTWSLYYLGDWRKRIRQWLNGIFVNKEDVESPKKTDREFLKALPWADTSNGCSRTRSGNFVRVPPAGRKGDIVAVFLGSKNVILLRPQEKPHTFAVIGPCYHPNFSYNEALLGDDFHGWDKLWDYNRGSPVFCQKDLQIRRTDPRLDDVPFPAGFGGDVSEKDGLPFFYQITSGSRVTLYNDPRLSEAELKKRGVPVQRFRLV